MQRSSRLAIVGAGFVGAEVASTAASMGLDVTIVETAATPLVRAVGVEVGRELVELHQTAGVKLVCQKAVTGFVGRDRVEGLTLDDGSILDVDLVLVGVGVVPDVEWLVGSGLELTDGLVCDDRLRTRVGSVFGAGDAVSWPSASVGGRTRSQQWTTASDQGRHLGKVLVHGESAGSFDHDLYFWSDQYGARIQGFGAPVGTAVVVDRDPAGRRYLAAFRDGDRIAGAVGINAPRDFVALRKLARRGASWPEVDDQFSALTPLDGGNA
jgi:NADPH-dependent 2,4-dienoyl-CoA reductase/sulfur reductase-like enzyme